MTVPVNHGTGCQVQMWPRLLLQVWQSFMCLSVWDGGGRTGGRLHLCVSAGWRWCSGRALQETLRYMLLWPRPSELNFSSLSWALPLDLSWNDPAPSSSSLIDCLMFQISVTLMFTPPMSCSHPDELQMFRWADDIQQMFPSKKNVKINSRASLFL